MASRNTHRDTPFRKLGTVVAASLMAAAVQVMPLAASAQILDVQAIAAIVNDEVISQFDIEQRLLIVTNGQPLSPELRQELQSDALKTIIDERLQIQEAINVNPAALSEVSMDDAIGRMRERNGMSETQFTDYIAQLGVERSAFEKRALAEALWSRLVSGRLGPQAAVSESEVRAILGRLERSIGLPEHHLAEIFVPVDSPDEEQAAYNTIQRAHRALLEGQPFDVLARSMSRGMTADEGGDINWVMTGALAPEVDAAVAKLEIGSVSAPLRGDAGYYIFLLRNRSVFGSIQALGDKLALRAIMWNVDDSVPAERRNAFGRRAQQVSGQIEECSDVFNIAEQSPFATAGYFGDVRDQELPSEIREAVLALDLNGSTEPIVLNDTLYVFSLCSREEPAPLMPSRDTILDQIFQQKLNMLARRYLRDLHAQAIIDIRSP